MPVREDLLYKSDTGRAEKTGRLLKLNQDQLIFYTMLRLIVYFENRR